MNLSLRCRVIRPEGLTPSGPAQGLFKTRCVLSCNSNYLVYKTPFHFNGYTKKMAALPLLFIQLLRQRMFNIPALRAL
jgi:hypothetical protein